MPRISAYMRLLVALVLAATIFPLMSRPARAATTTWDTLVLVYRSTDVTYTWEGKTSRLRTSMTSTDVQQAVSTVKRTPATVYNWSGNLANMRMTVVYPNHPVKRVSLHANPDLGLWLSPADIAADLDTYAPAGRYDSIFVIWRRDNDAGQIIPDKGWGWTTADRTHTNGAYYSVVTLLPNHRGWPGTYPEEVWVHEWLHQAEAFYRSKGYSVPGLHDTSIYGYTAFNGSWRKWYEAYMRGRIWSGSAFTGITPTAWASGTPTLTSSGQNYAPQAGTMTASSGTSYVGRQLTLTNTYSDGNGWKNIAWTSLLLRDTNGRPQVRVMYNQNTNKMYLRKLDGSGWIGGYAPGTAVTIRDKHVNLNIGASSISGSGNTLTVRWNFTFNSLVKGADYRAQHHVVDDISIQATPGAVGTCSVR